MSAGFFLNECGHQQRLDLGQLLHFAHLTPTEELADGAKVS
jgi:hypothetical protein